MSHPKLGGPRRREAPPARASAGPPEDPFIFPIFGWILPLFGTICYSLAARIELAVDQLQAPRIQGTRRLDLRPSPAHRVDHSRGFHPPNPCLVRDLIGKTALGVAPGGR